MEQDDASSINDIPRKFGYKSILWEVENYTAARCKKNWIIYSPEFSVIGGPVTKWRLSIEGKCIREHYFVRMHLERLETDQFPGAVRVRWRFSYPSLGLSDRELACDFERKTRISKEVSNLQFLESNIRTTSSYTFKVECSMIVYEKDKTRYNISDDLGLKYLSQDMAILCKMGRKSDVTLFVGCNIFAHKAILCTRNSTFKSVIESQGETIIMDSKWINQKAAEDLIAFLYTANVYYVFRTPSFSLHDLINYFNVTELKCYFTEDKLTIRTSVEMQEFSFKWCITNISSKESDSISSPCWRLENSNVFFQLTLHLKRFEVNDHLSIFGQFVKEEGPKELYVECSILDANEVRQGVKCLYWTSDENKQLGFEKFIEKSILNDSNLIVNGNLRIVFSLQIPNGTQSHCVVNSTTYSLGSASKYPHLETLSADLGRLFETGEYSDFSVSSRIIRYKAHKAILRSRSHVFARLLADLEGETCLSFPDVDAYTLRIVLRYMYTGTLNSNERLENLMKIYASAEKFGMLALKYTCSQFLQKRIDMQNVFDILVSANKNKDFKLKVSAFNFICVNADQIVQLESWNNFLDANVSLSKELGKYMKKFITAYKQKKAQRIEKK